MAYVLQRPLIELGGDTGRAVKAPIAIEANMVKLKMKSIINKLLRGGWIKSTLAARCASHEIKTFPVVCD